MAARRLKAIRTILHVFPTFRVGGAQVRFAQIANHFGRRCRNLIFAMDGAYDCRQRLRADLDVQYPVIESVKDNTATNWLAFRRALKEHKPDLLVTYNWGSIEWALSNWPRCVEHIHVEDGFGPDEASGQFLRRIVTRRAALSRSTVVVPSRTLEKIALEVWRLPPQRVRYIPNGIDCKRFARLPGHEAAEPPLIGTVAALRKEKNLERLLRAFARVRATSPCRLIVVGDGPERSALEALAVTLEVAPWVTFAGHVSDPSALYGTFDIFALSSDTEQMPYTVLEAMAAGCPIAATNVGDILQMVSQANRAFVVPKGDEYLAQALETLLIQSAERTRIGLENAERAKANFSEQEMFAQFEKLYFGMDSSPTRPAKA